MCLFPTEVPTPFYWISGGIVFFLVMAIVVVFIVVLKGKDNAEHGESNQTMIHDDGYNYINRIREAFFLFLRSESLNLSPHSFTTSEIKLKYASERTIAKAFALPRKYLARSNLHWVPVIGITIGQNNHD